ncbi:MAG: hypothetical protein M3Y48_04130 [Actinomycetota bacterium]|nr:hypothetical protein [Actinomycetota bacterium]
MNDKVIMTGRQPAVARLDTASELHNPHNVTKGTKRPPTGPERYRSGPWLVIYGHGPASEDAAKQVCEECTLHGVDTKCCAIDQVASINLAYFTALVLVLPSARTASLLSTLEQFVRAILSYCARRPYGLNELLYGNCAWYEAGVIHVIGLRGIMQHPRVKSALARDCVKYYLDDLDPPDLFKAYDGQKVDLAHTSTQNSDAHIFCGNDERADIDSIWRYLQSWGLTSSENVPQIRKCIEGCRDRYEDDRFPALRRPNPNAPSSNMLDLILDGPHVVVGDPKTWMENGARVWRYVERRIREIEPNFHRPKGAKKRGAQAALRQFYLNLRIISDYISLSD